MLQYNADAIIEYMIEGGQGLLPSTPLDMEYDNSSIGNRHSSKHERINPQISMITYCHHHHTK